ncbi:MAG: DsrE family protein [ANME-2 cluster archaeon]|nr:DsrE family protein [ANME-2 cluster archaeon]MDF1531791.1 DsrE family protein [ANME-2 cluster archaeon]
MKLGILLTTPPSHQNTRSVIQLSRAAREHGHDVGIFMMADGVYNILYQPLLDLVNNGVELSLCAHNATQRGLERVEGVLWGSQYDLAVLTDDSDRFLTF